MKVGIISDIHGNQYALAEILELFKSQRVERIFLLGDIVGYYYGVKEILKMLRDWDYDCVKGNHEEILEMLFYNKLKEDFIVAKYGSGYITTLKTLSPQELSLLFDLQKIIEIQVNEKRILFCHTNPWLGEEYIYPDSPTSLLNKFGNYNFDFIFFGHSHYPFSFFVNNTLCINPGSVGQPRDRYSQPSCVIFDTNNFVFTFLKVPYDKKSLIKEIKKYDANNKYLISVLDR